VKWCNTSQLRLQATRKEKKKKNGGRIPQKQKKKTA